MATLNRAVALAQGHVVAEIVGKNLDLDVTGTQNQLLKVDAVVAERRTGLGASGHVLRLKIHGIMDLAHALAAAASGCLDKHGVADAIGEFLRLCGGVDAAVRTRDGGDATRLHGFARSAFVAHALDALGRRADEDQVVVRAGAGELGVFRQEAVTGMDGLGAGVLRSGDDVGHDQVALVSGSGADAHSLVRVANGIGVFILGRVNGDRFHTQLASGAHDAQRHLATVCDKDFLEHYAVSGAGAGLPSGST